MTMMRVLIVCLIAGLSPILTQRADNTDNTCSDGKWACLNGECIPALGKCNGTVECADKTDESFPTCRKNVCGEEWFRCAYGACVNLTARCDEIRDCADSSDELLPSCLNELDTHIICRRQIIDDRQLSVGIDCVNSRDTCLDSSPATGQSCDGHIDCPDKSDETLTICADSLCEDQLFRCAYGGCVREDAACDGISDCADGSDETAELCDRISPGVSITTSTTLTTSNTSTTTTVKPICTLPPYPEHGTYEVPGHPEAAPGSTIDTLVVYIQYSCEPDYGVLGEPALFCNSALWSGDFPTCVRYCKVPKHPSVEYRCILSGTDGLRACNATEPEGTTVQPVCRGPVYHHIGILSLMHCVDGTWDYIAVCEPDCGKVTAAGEALINGGHPAGTGELPWHAGVYRKGLIYQPICGGTVISTTVVISAAQCVWSDTRKLLPASQFVVTVGKLFRNWNTSWDGAQRIDVHSITIPDHYQGAATNYQGDIALLKLTSTIEYTERVRPVCLDFDLDFDSQQLLDGSKGRIAGWGFTSVNRTVSHLVKVVDMPYVKVERCIALAPDDYKAYITSDKICAGYDNDTALCEGDSGGGLSFPEQSSGSSPRFFLRGVASSSSHGSCRTRSIAVFTHLLYYKHFLQDNLLI